MAAPLITPDPSGVAGPLPGGASAPPGPAGPNFDPTGTVPVAGSPADPMHPAQQAAPPVAPAPAPPAPATVEGPSPPPGYTQEVDGSTTSPGVPQNATEAARRQYLASQASAQVVADQAVNAKEQADLQVQADAKKADLEKQQLAETQADQERERAGMSKAVAERDSLKQDVKDFRFHNFWDDRSTGQKILAGIGVILGSASYDPNHVNEAARSIDTAVTNEWNAQRAELDRKFKLAQDAGEDVRQLQSQYQYEAGKLALRQELQLKALASEMDALSSRSRNQAGVLAAQKLAAEARVLAETQGQAGVKAIAEAHTQRLKDSETVAATANLYSEIRERAAKTARERTGTLTKKEQLTEAKQAYTEYNNAVKDLVQPKTGLVARQEELANGIDKVEKDEKNPLNWVALIDNMAKTNTGGKVTMSQYQQIYGHAAGSQDALNQGLAKWLSGNPSAKQRSAFLGAAHDSLSELEHEGAEANRNFRENAFNDPRYQSNPMAQNVISRLERNTFGRMRGYGKADATAPAPAPTQLPFDLPKGSTLTDKKAGGKPVYVTPSGHYVQSTL